jgi:hypothetical protein
MSCVTKGLRIPRPHVARHLAQSPAHLALEVAHQFAEYVLLVGDLDCGIAERAATAFLVLDCHQVRFEQCLDLAPRVVGKAGDGRVPVFPDLALLFSQVFGDQLILGRKAAIETHLVGTGFRGNRVDPDAADAVAIKQLAGGIEDPIAYARLGSRGLGIVPGGIIVGGVHILLGSS